VEFIRAPSRIVSKDTKGWSFFIFSFYMSNKVVQVLHPSKEKYRVILESIEELYYEVDLAGNLTFSNNSMSKILGYSKDELIGMNNRQYMEQETAKKVYQTFNEVYQTGTPTKAFDWELIRKDGTKRILETSVDS
jgi:PAS domain S-box-containing protein